MARLRSNRWYSADGQRRSRTVVSSSVNGTRRVISLCFLLGLVIVLMQKVADPQHVQCAFDALGVPLDTPVNSPEEAASDSMGVAGKPVQADTHDNDALKQTRWENVCGDLLPRLMEDASGELINKLSLRWFRTGAAGGWTPDAQEQRWYDETLSRLETLAADLDARPEMTSATEQAELADWHQLLERFQNAWIAWFADLQADEPAGIDDDVFRQQITDYLDQRLVANLRDAAPWTSNEAVPFWRLLQRASKPVGPGEGGGGAEVVDPPLFNTLQLQAEGAQLKGTPVRFRGSVRRVERIARRHEFLAASDGYWLLWLRGADQSDQPVAVYTTQRVASQFERVLAADRFPEVEVLGLVGKKLAYAASSGVEVAPTLFASSVYQRIAPEVATNGKSPQAMGRELQVALVGGLLLAGALVVPILSSWRRRADRRLPRSRSLGCILLAVVSVASVPHDAVRAAAPTVAQTQPPWARSPENSDLASMLKEQLEGELDASFVAAMQRYIDGDVGRFPDSGLKLAFALRKLARQQRTLPALSLELDAAKIGLETLELSGMVRLAMPVALEDQQQLWFQPDNQPRLYRLEVELSSVKSSASAATPARFVSVFCERIPASWLVARQLLQPVLVRGVAVRPRVAGTQENAQQSENTQVATAGPLCLFAPAVQWRQAADLGEIDLQPTLTVNARRLLAAGWDLSHLDAIRRRQQQPLETEDLQPFYSLLAVAERVRLQPGGRVDVQSTTRPTASEIDPLFAVLKDPPAHAAAHIQWPIRLVRGTEVRVSDPQAVQLLGASTYFQFDGFVDIGRKMIQYRTGNAADAEVVPFQGEFPITLVARSCPTAFAKPTDENDATWEIGRAATASGLFYRLWSFESERMNAVNTTARQAAPLVVLQDLQPRTIQVSRTDNTGWFGYALMVAMVVISGGIIWMAASKK